MKKMKGKHGSFRGHPEGYGHGHMEAGMKEHPVERPHEHKPMGMHEGEKRSHGKVDRGDM